mgnify:CR=1 FL=1
MRPNPLAPLFARRLAVFTLWFALALLARAATEPKNFVPLFNGKDLTGWKGLPKGAAEFPAGRAKMNAEQLAAAQKDAERQAVRTQDMTKEEAEKLIGGTLSQVTKALAQLADMQKQMAEGQKSLETAIKRLG